MLNSGKKNCTSRDKKINILTLVLSEKKISEQNKKTSFKLNGRSLIYIATPLTDHWHCFIGSTPNTL